MSETLDNSILINNATILKPAFLALIQALVLNVLDILSINHFVLVFLTVATILKGHLHL